MDLIFVYWFLYTVAARPPIILIIRRPAGCANCEQEEWNMRKKRILGLALASVTALGLLSGCGGGGSGGLLSGTQASDGGKVLNIYVWNEEFQGKFNENYPEVERLSNDKSVAYLKDGTEVHWIVNPTQDGVYQQKLDEALLKQGRAAADERVDMFLVEADYALKYVDPEVNVALPISQLGITDADIANQYRYTLEAMTGSDGEIRGLSYQATPGMLVYRRSIAQAVLGTDDPEVVGAAVADWDKFYETAGQMKKAGYYMYSGRADTARVYSNNVSAPWVKNDKTVVVDPNMMNWVERSMEDIASGVSHNVPGQWNDEWNKDMGPDSKVFCFFLPAWGLDVCIAPNVKDTAAAQDWAVCPSPQSFFWGGTWLVAANGTDNASQVRDIMLTMTADRDLLRTLALNYGEMSNDQPLMEELAQSPDFGIDLLGGQNYIGVLSDVAATVDLSNISSYDQGCVEEFQNTFGDYFNGKISLDKAKANFEMSITERYPWLVGGGVEWP